MSLVSLVVRGAPSVSEARRTVVVTGAPDATSLCAGHVTPVGCRGGEMLHSDRGTSKRVEPERLVVATGTSEGRAHRLTLSKLQWRQPRWPLGQGVEPHHHAASW